MLFTALITFYLCDIIKVKQLVGIHLSGTSFVQRFIFLDFNWGLVRNKLENHSLYWIDSALKA